MELIVHIDCYLQSKLKANWTLIVGTEWVGDEESRLDASCKHYLLHQCIPFGPSTAAGPR